MGAREGAEERTCFFPVEALGVAEPLDLPGARLLPPDDPSVPEAAGRFHLDPPVGAVVAVPVTGTNLAKMMERARPVAEHTMRALRTAVRSSRSVPDLQLRFRLADAYSFGGQLAGFQMHPDARVQLDLDEELLGLLADDPVVRLGAEPDDDLGRHADRALRWLDQAALETEPVTGMLFGFFALEAMLGRRDQGLKAHDLAFHRALLGVAASERFSDPDRLYRLYDVVRSDAVHGGEPELDDGDYRAFSWDSRLALAEYLGLAGRENIQTRRAMLRHLRRHPDRSRLEEWLRDNGEPGWADYLDERRGSGGGA